MRRAYDRGELRAKDLAEIYGVHPSTATHAVTRRTWRHLP
jgi:Mn-dependent DtxR family transcriptional regulator